MTNSVGAEDGTPGSDAANTASTLVFRLTGEAWERVLVCALIVMVVALLVAGLAAFSSALSRRRDADAARQTLDRFAETAAARIAAARADGMAAGIATGKASGEAAARAEREHLSAENLRLQEIVDAEKPVRPPEKKKPKPVAPQADGLRSTELNAEKITALTAALKSGAGNVSIDYDGADTRTQPLSTQLQRAFENAGWNVSSGIMLGIATPPKTGILVRVNQAGPTTQQDVTTRAFKSAGIPFDLRLDRQPKPYWNGQAHTPFGMGPNDVEIFVTAPER